MGLIFDVVHADLLRAATAATRVRWRDLEIGRVQSSSRRRFETLSRRRFEIELNNVGLGLGQLDDAFYLKE